MNICEVYAFYTHISIFFQQGRIKSYRLSISLYIKYIGQVLEFIVSSMGSSTIYNN